MDNQLSVKVEYDKENTKNTHIEINGYVNVKEFLIEVRDVKVNEYLAKQTKEQIEKTIMCKGDVDGNGLEEGIITYEDKLYLIDCSNEDEYKNLGWLSDDYSVGHVYVDADIRSLDKSNKKYIVINIAHDATFAQGYFIYDYNGYLPEVIYIDFPGATAHGSRQLMDYDQDGIEDHVRFDQYADIQQHQVITYNSFSGGTESKELRYLNPTGEFHYPSEPEKVVAAYIEATCLVKEADDEQDAYLTNAGLKKNIHLKYSPNTITYMGIELDVTVVKEDENIVVIDAKEEPYYDKTITTRFYLKKINDKWKIDDIKSQDNTLIELDNNTLKEISEETLNRLKQEISEHLREVNGQKKGDIEKSLKVGVLADSRIEECNLQLVHIQLDYAWLNGFVIYRDNKIIGVLGGMTNDKLYLTDLNEDGKKEILF